MYILSSSSGSSSGAAPSGSTGAATGASSINSSSLSRAVSENLRSTFALVSANVGRSGTSKEVIRCVRRAAGRVLDAATGFEAPLVCSAVLLGPLGPFVADADETSTSSLEASFKCFLDVRCASKTVCFA